MSSSMHNSFEKLLALVVRCQLNNIASYVRSVCSNKHDLEQVYVGTHEVYVSIAPLKPKLVM